MAINNPYKELLKHYEFLMGPIPLSEEFLVAFEKKFSLQDAQIAASIPAGSCLLEELEANTDQVGISKKILHERLPIMVREGLIKTYNAQNGVHFEKGSFMSLVEIQVRQKDSPLRDVAAKSFDLLIEGYGESPTKTPWYRTVPIENAIQPDSVKYNVTLDVDVPDTREVLPPDLISQLIYSRSPIAVTDCACRISRAAVGKDCGHPIETCICFGQFAEAMVTAGSARYITAEEALEICHKSEELGLVHNASNCEEDIDFLCNCCSCSCLILKSIERGEGHWGIRARFVSSLIEDRCTACEACIPVCPTGALSLPESSEVIDINETLCIGCGLCVLECPEEALVMELRQESPDIPKNMDSLISQLLSEASESNS